MKRGLWLLLVVIPVAAAAAWALYDARPDLDGAMAVDRPPSIAPDFSETVIPPNIAPLNFVVREEGRRYFVRIASEAGEPIEIFGHSPRIVISPKRWKDLLQGNRGELLRIEVYVHVDGSWRQFQTVRNRIAHEDIDPYLAYRRIRPMYNLYRETAIFKRDLTTYRESLLFQGKRLDEGCVNCHTFVQNRPDRMLLGMRSREFGTATLVAEADGRVRKVGVKLGFTAWHPSGRVAAYQVQEVGQCLHTAQTETRDVIDAYGALAYYMLDAQKTKPIPGATGAKRLESYPTWSPDGRHLYYCGAAVPWKKRETFALEDYSKFRYDLMRISYDVDTDQWGKPEIVLSSQQTAMSIFMPRVSPDGRFVLVCMSDHGCFPNFEPDSDLYLVNLATRTYARLDVNSDSPESWHCWSSNGRWIAFSSKRRAMPFTMCYLSHVDENGKASKPFILPQSDPEFYDSLLDTFNVPEFITGPVTVSAETIARAARSNDVESVDGLEDVAPVTAETEYAR